MNILRYVFSLIFPDKCACCEELIFENKIVCNRCFDSLIVDGEKFEVSDNFNKCKIYCVSPFEYKDFVREMVLKFKFKNRLGLCKFFAEEMSKCAYRYYKNIDVITYVPMPYFKKIIRKYDQCEFLSCELSNIMDIPCKKLLSAVSVDKEQHRLSASERNANVKGLYKVSPFARVNGENILLVDDVCTTGSTLRECSEILIKNGAKSVNCITAAHTRK